MGIEGGRSRKRPADYYSGRMFERDFIGVVDVERPEYQAAYRAAADADGYVPYDPAVRLARRSQPYDPAQPEKPFARDLLFEVADKLRLAPRDQQRLKFYTSVHTPLDHKHGVDGFLELEDPKTRTVRRITFDLSLDRRKHPKADILVRELPAPDDPDPSEANRYLKDVESYAAEVVRMLQYTPPTRM